MPVPDALRSTRLGSLKYDKHWLDGGRVNDILDLCNSFNRTLTLSAADKRVIATSPPHTKSPDEGLGGGQESRKQLQSISDGILEARESELVTKGEYPASFNGETKVLDESCEGISGFDLAAVRNESEWEERAKAQVDKRLKLFRESWEQCQKKAISPPTSVRPISPVLTPPSSFDDYCPSKTSIETVPVTVPAEFNPSQVSHVDKSDKSIVYRLPSHRHYIQDPIIEELPQSEPVVLPQFRPFTEERNAVATHEKPVVPQPTEPMAIDGHTRMQLPQRANESAASVQVQTFVVPPPAMQTFPQVDHPVAAERRAPIQKTAPMEGIESLERTAPVEGTARVEGTAPVERTVPVPTPEADQFSLPRLPEATTEEDKQCTAMDADEADTALGNIRLNDLDATRFRSNNRLKEYKRQVADWLDKRQWYEGIQRKLATGLCSKNADRVTKGIRQELTVGVTTTINLLSRDNIKESLTRLGQLLEGRTVSFRGKNLTVQKHPDARHFCCDLIARTLVKQAETIVSVQPKMAFPFAAMAICLSVDFPEVFDFITAAACSNCLYLVPYYVPRGESESDNEYYVKLGYQCTSKGELEKQHLFLSRMTGICRLWAAMICTPAISWRQYPSSEHAIVRSTANGHPIDFNWAWRFLAVMAQLAPRTDITATILLEFLQITSHFLRMTYGKQYDKLLRFIKDRYLVDVEAVSSSGAGSAAFVSLKTFLNSGSKRYSLPEDYPPSWRRLS